MQSSLRSAIRKYLPAPIKQLGAMALWQGGRIAERLDRTESAWGALRGTRSGRTCVIVGNGPSLARTDLGLAASVDTFGLNRIYLLAAETGFVPTYHVVVNELLFEQFAAEFEAVPSILIVPSRQKPRFSRRHRIHFFRQRPDGTFSTDLRDGVTAGGTVTCVAMQIAFHLGYDRVLLVGVDHRYAHDGRPNQELVSTADDPNHFSGKYFGPGVRWNAPDLVASEASYRQARNAFGKAGRRIIDCTVDGALTLFPKSTLEAELGNAPN
jgi:Protein of unknown function DUF115